MINRTQIRAAGAQTWVVWVHINTLKQTCHVGPALPAPTMRSGAATTGKLIDRQIGIQGKLIGRQIGIQGKLIGRQIGIQGKLIGIQGKLIGIQGKRESRSLFPLLGVCFLC
jgi:hypothetical protein